MNTAKKKTKVKREEKKMTYYTVGWRKKRGRKRKEQE